MTMILLISRVKNKRGNRRINILQTVEKHLRYFESLTKICALEVEKVNSVNRKLKETNADLTTELARYKNQEKSQYIGIGNLTSLESSPFKHYVYWQNPSFLKIHHILQTELDRTKERLENCIIKKENEYAKLWNDWYKKCEECKYDKISYDKAYNDMQQKIERLQAQLGDLKGKSTDTPCVSNTLDPLSQKLENENVELEFQLRAQLFDKVSDQVDTTKGTSTNTKFANQKVDETNDLSKPVTSNSVPTPQESKKRAFRTTPITVSQPHVITKKDVNSDSNGLSSTRVDNTAKTRRPQPRSNTKNDRVPSASKSSCSKNKEVEVEGTP
ncbi:hypothetical protein Tco_1209388 [Tanacetum coccineum]